MFNGLGGQPLARWGDYKWLYGERRTRVGEQLLRRTGTSQPCGCTMPFRLREASWGVAVLGRFGNGMPAGIFLAYVCERAE
jgi:hypothetical protein